MKVVNLVYDFDGTITNSKAPRYKIIEKCGYSYDDFNKLTIENKNKYGFYDGWYMTLIEIIKSKYKNINDELLSYGSLDITYNPGILSFLKNFKIDNTNIKHYIVTSGIKNYIDNTLIAPYIEKTYGTTFKYDDNNYITGIEEISTSIKKIEHIKNINISNNRNNEDCTNLIYIGDGMTDYDAFEFVKNHNGISILVYTEEIIDDRLNKVINAFFKADYTFNSPLIEYITKVLDN